MASKTAFHGILRINYQTSIQKQPYSVNNAQIKHIQTVLITKHDSKRYKSELYKLHFKKQRHLFQKKNKKNPKKISFEGSLGWAGVPYGGGCTLTGAWVKFSPMQPTAQGLQFHTHTQ